MAGCTVSQSRMPSFSFILSLDIHKDSQSGLFPGSEFSVVDQLGFHGFEKLSAMAFSQQLAHRSNCLFYVYDKWYLRTHYLHLQDV